RDTTAAHRGRDERRYDQRPSVRHRRHARWRNAAPRGAGITRLRPITGRQGSAQLHAGLRRRAGQRALSMPAFPTRAQRFGYAASLSLTLARLVLAAPFVWLGTIR